MHGGRPFLVCLHDASPRFERETSVILRALAPLVGRQLSCGVVPDWHGQWPLAAHAEYCAMVREAADELLLHGYFHRRVHGRGIVSVLTGGADEMNGVNSEETLDLIACGQAVFSNVFGGPARGFLPPAWQRGQLDAELAGVAGLEYTFGYFSIDLVAQAPSAQSYRHSSFPAAAVAGVDISARVRVPLATWSWDCGRFGWLGHVGDGVGRAMLTLKRSVPVLAIHPRDIERGFWPRIMRLTQDLLDEGYEPATPSALLHARSDQTDAEIAV